MDCGKAPQSLQPDAEAHGTSIFSKCKVLKGGLVATITALSGLCLLITAGCIFQHQIRAFLVYFIALVDGMGMWGGVFFAGVYFVLEVLAVPAIPLEMASGAMFGIVPGYMIVAFSSVLAATASFLIARYTARDWVRSWAEKSKQFRAMNRMIERNGFKVVTLVRLSPLLPLALSNYLYGVTNVSLTSYMLGSWLGMLPTTLVYVTAGRLSKTAFLEGDSLQLKWWQVAVAFTVSAAAMMYISSLATAALRELEEEEDEQLHITNVVAVRELDAGGDEQFIHVSDSGTTVRHGGLLTNTSVDTGVLALRVVSGSEDLETLSIVGA